MSRKRSSKSSKYRSDYSEDFLINVNDVEEILDVKLCRTTMYYILIFNVITIIYSVFFLHLILNNDNYLNIGSISFLYYLLFHGLLEFLKFIVHQKLVFKMFKFNPKLYLYFIPTYFLVVLVCYFFIVLFGANLIENIEETFVLSCTLSSLLLIPLYFYCGVDALSLLILREKPSTLLHSSILYVCFSSVIGAWFGAFVIPLDWDRKWQIWPVPCVIGSLVGFTLGHTYSFFKVFACILQYEIKF